MSLRVGILAARAIIGIAMLDVWRFAPSAYTESRRLLVNANLEWLMARAGLWAPF